MFYIEHSTARVGKASELTAALALINTGWQGVSFPLIDTDYDIVAKDAVNGEWKTFQVKSLRKRTDRNGELVIPGKKSNGKKYEPSVVDYMIGVDVDTDAVYVTECVGHSEYWSSGTTISKRWVNLNTESEAV